MRTFPVLAFIVVGSLAWVAFAPIRAADDPAGNARRDDGAFPGRSGPSWPPGSARRSGRS